MHIQLANVVLFLHIAVAVTAFAVAAVMHVGQLQMRGTGDMAVLRSWGRVVRRTEPLFPVLVLALIGLGGWLIALSDKEFSWTDSWVLTSVITLVAMEAFGGIVLAPAGKRLHALLEDEPDGPVPPPVRAEVCSRLVWAGSFANTGLATGILFVMPTQPTGVWPVVIVVAAGLVAAALGTRLASSAAPVRESRHLRARELAG